MKLNGRCSTQEQWLVDTSKSTRKAITSSQALPEKKFGDTIEAQLQGQGQEFGEGHGTEKLEGRLVFLESMQIWWYMVQSNVQCTEATEAWLQAVKPRSRSQAKSMALGRLGLGLGVAEAQAKGSSRGLEGEK
ncbi:hypothetical protein DFH08DRAFT_800109 [Mycena albidolilacea]|uniref:Uncharacterized protein n=1 Tax=Mycena albidolilacea TaxID=1033008 RepID=A0AAD7AJC1_9AGAR|nr:hypothetical protein DFH08DRAFT_800109 [Mycena albidolilacea]